ncbi:MAG: DNA-processing protein DprA [Candidatus Woesearchaeota archaeon]
MPSPTVDEASSETAALVALLRSGGRPPAQYADLLEEAGSAQLILESEQGLLASGLIAAARDELSGWEAQGWHLKTVLDRDYPENLKAVHDRPPLIFLAGRLEPADARAVAVIGSRRASEAGVERARLIAEALIDSGYTVVSGLASGIDTAAHRAALERGARTLAVIGTGLRHCYPAENRRLQREIAATSAVVSQFWPELGPSRDRFPARNAVMSGISLATVIVEAAQTSGARIQARHALAHGRPVLLDSSMLDQPWARQLAGKPGAYVIASGAEAAAVVDRLTSTEVPAA